VHLLGFLVEAQRDLKTGEDKRHFLAEVHIKFFRRPHELQSKRHDSKNYKFILYLFFSNILLHLDYTDTFINMYILTVFYSIFYQLANKTRNLLFAIQLLILIIIYGDRTIIAIIICDVQRRIRH
jgi:hypothetical protein